MRRPPIFPASPRAFGISPGARPYRGSTLLLIAVFLVVFFGFAALVIDLGIIRASQRSMQTAVEGAASEALRHRDDPMTDERANARDFVRATFDDDWDVSTDPIGLGAGPIIAYDAGFGGPVYAGRRILATGTYDPVLQLNDGSGPAPADEPHGDIVAGTYTYAAPHLEGLFPNSYVRPDFAAGGPGTPESFLVRIRRTADTMAPDLNNIPGVSSSGPAFPPIFLHGTAMLNETPGDSVLRRQGFSLRATGIADAEPVLTAGPEFPPTIAGAAPWALRLDVWNALTPNVWTTAQVLPSGEIVVTGAPGPTDGWLIRRTQTSAGIGAGTTSIPVDSLAVFPPLPFKVRIGASEIALVTGFGGGPSLQVDRGINGTTATPHPAGTLIALHETAMIGQELLTGPAPDNGFTAPPDIQFVPVFDTIAGAGERFVGFGGGRLRPVLPLPSPLVYPVDVEVIRLDSRIPSRNAMAQLVEAPDVTLTPVQLSDIFAARLTVEDSLQAPALVRAYGE